MTKPKPTKYVQVSVNVVTNGILDADTTYYKLPHDKLEEIKEYLREINQDKFTRGMI